MRVAAGRRSASGIGEKDKVRTEDGVGLRVLAMRVCANQGAKVVVLDRVLITGRRGRSLPDVFAEGLGELTNR